MISRTNAVLLLVLLFTACVSDRTITAVNEFPSPLVEQYPFAIGLYLGADLTGHVHHEELPDGSNWTVELGKANSALFREMMTGLFASVKSVSSTTAPGSKAVIKPMVMDYQFSTPDQSKTEYFETWIKYQIEVYSASGQLVTEWPFTAYGRSQAGFLATEAALRQATKRAMRDAATAMTLELMQQPAVRAHFYGTAAAWSQRARNDQS